MANRRQVRVTAAICLIFSTIFFFGCAQRQAALQDQVTTEYMLSKAGFQPYRVNMETPESEALLSALPSGEITTFRADNSALHAYPDKQHNILYIGNETAYQNYVGLAHGKNLCQRVDAPNSSGFWSCFQELQKAGAGPK